MVKTLNATFLFVTLLAALGAFPSPANALSNMNMSPPARRHNIIADRMVKKVKRQKLPDVGLGNGGGGGDPKATTSDSSGATSKSNPPADSTPSKTASSDKATSSDKPNQTPPSSSSNTPTSDASKSDSQIVSKPPAQTVSPSASSSTPASLTSPTPTASAQPGQNSASNPPSDVTLHATVTIGPTATSAAADDSQGAAPISKSTIIVIIVVVASIAAVAALWTIIRKWKFSPSRQFEDRLEPINYDPDQHSSAAAATSGENALARANSNGSNGQSSIDHRSNLAPAPNLAPEYPPDMYPGDNYAHLQRADTYYRGLSPQPQMNQIGGPVYSGGAYDGYDAGPAPFAGHQDAYGGYTQHPDAEYHAPPGPYRGY